MPNEAGPSEFRSKALAAVRWTSTATALRVMLQVVQLMAVARLLDPSEIGLMALILSVTSVIQVFADLGVSSTIIAARDISQRALATLFWVNVGVGLVLSLLLIGAAPWIATFFHAPGMVSPLQVTALSFVLIALGQQVRVLGEKHLAFKRIAIAEIGAAALSTIVCIFGAASGWGVYSLVIGFVALGGFNSIFYWILLPRPRQLWAVATFAEVVPFLRDGFFLLGSSLSNIATMQSDTVIVGRFLGTDALGPFSLVRELALKVMLATNPIVTRVLTPLVAHASHSQDAVSRAYLATIRTTSSINFPIYGAMAAFSPEIVALFLGSKWLSSAPLLSVLAIWGAFRSLGNPLGSLLQGTGNARLAFVQSLLVLLTLVPVLYAGTGHGTMGVAFASTIYYALFSVAAWGLVVRPLTGATLGGYSRQWLVPFALASASSASALAVTYPVEEPLLRLIVGVPAGAFAYLALSSAFNTTWLKAMLDLVGAGRRRKDNG